MVPWDTLFTSVVLYIVIPVILAQIWRRLLLKRGQAAFDATMAKLGHASILALLATLVLLFAFQGEAIIAQPLIIALLAVPILIQVFFNSGLAYWLNRKVGEKHSVACPSALIGASNFFELAVAAAICAVRLPVRRGAGHRGRRADRGAGDAAGGEDRQPQQGLV